jgi:hypothetical protein
MRTELIEATFRTWIREGVTAETILVALHNACVHGELLDEVAYNVTDKQLGRLFDGFEMSLKALRKMTS